MAETNVCIWAGTHGRTVRHECSTTYCELDHPDKIAEDIMVWEAIGITNSWDREKLRVALERQAKA